MFEDLEPRAQRGAAVASLAREDLELYAVDELNERIEALETEITRVRAAIASKNSRKSAADALFNFDR